jgi:hypothetical protein
MILPVIIGQFDQKPKSIQILYGDPKDSTENDSQSTLRLTFVHNGVPILWSLKLKNIKKCFIFHSQSDVLWIRWLNVTPKQMDEYIFIQ